METKIILRQLREKAGLTQDQLAEKAMVTRQAVSRWENGDTQPNTDTLKILSREFNVSINTLLGSPRRLVCQCCGMPLDDEIISRGRDGAMNEDYCRWCYADGNFMYDDMDDLIGVCVPQMISENCTEEEARDMLKQTLPELDYWKRHDELSDRGRFNAFKQRLIREINDLKIEGMPLVKKLNALVGKYVNLEYPLAGGMKAKFLDDGRTYQGTQLEGNDGRYYGIAADTDFILVSSYGEGGSDPELILYKKR